ncbi:MAG: archaellin/type IV pilin N-terminal domain-containing protein [Nanoarchaeota archaeon]|mgnify:CR=1 FL=1
MKREFGKKGLSPIISTAILIIIVIVLAIIILLWSRGFIKEAVIKEIAGNSKRAEEFCREIKMRGILNEDDSFGFENTGSVPIFAYRVKLEGAGKSKIIKIDNENGGAVNPEYSVIVDHLEIKKHSEYESVKIIPILLGKVQGGTQEYECPEYNGIEI